MDEIAQKTIKELTEERDDLRMALKTQISKNHDLRIEYHGFRNKIALALADIKEY